MVESDSQAALNDITTGGQVLAIYTFGGKRTIEDDSLKGLFHLGDASDEPAANAYGLSFSQVGDYTFIPGDPGEVCLNLTLERVGKTQITVTGITNDANNQWVLYSCGVGAEVFNGISRLAAVFESGAFNETALCETSTEEVIGVNNGSDAVTFYVAGIDYASQSVRLILHNTKTKKNYIRILDGTKVTPGTAYTTEAPTLDEEGNISVDKGWKQGFLIEYTADSEWTAKSTDFEPSEVVAKDYSSEEKRGYVIFKSGCPQSAFESNTGIKTAVIQKGVTTIGENAFSACSALESISLPSTLNTIGDYTFEYCFALESISLPSTLNTIGMSAFFGCSALGSISLPEGITTIGERTFSGCSALESVTLPSTLNTIGMSAFYGCSALGSISLPSTLNTIGAYAFDSCSSLATVTCLPDTPPRLASSVFTNTHTDLKIYVPAGSVGAYMSTLEWNDLSINSIID